MSEPPIGSSDAPTGRLDPTLAGTIALLAIAALWAVGIGWFDGWLLDLGSLFAPPPRTAAFYLAYALTGGIAAWTLARWLAPRIADSQSLAASWSGGSDRHFVVGAALIAAVPPLLVRRVVLFDAPLTDDESAYRFMAELLASGRLWVESPAERLFFDRAFMINDGRLYAGYFVGWPALAAPFVALGLGALANPVLAALTVPPVFWLLRDHCGSGWARAGALLAATAPMLVAGAATELTHTSCTAALAWTLWLAHRAARTGSPPWVDAGLATAFSVAFFVRPLSAIGIALPALGAWLLSRCRDGERRLPRLLAFGLPASLFAAAFLAVQWAQTGSPFEPAYNRLLAFAAENRYRFAAFGPDAAAHVGNFRFEGLGVALARTAAGLVRLNFDLFGWPSAFALAWWARGRAAHGLWAAIGCFLVLHLFVSDPGIDSFGPVHFFELGLPLVLLSILGAARHRRGAAVLLALVAVAAVTYVPVRLRALHRIGENISLPARTVEAIGIENAVIFAPRPFAPWCRSEPTRHFVFFRPNNDPDLENDVLWVNHLSIAADRELMRARFPDRRGYLMAWLALPDEPPGGPARPAYERCKVGFLPLDSPAAEGFADGYTGEVSTTSLPPDAPSASGPDSR